MKRLTRSNIVLLITLFTGIVFVQSCKKENEVTVKAQIEGTWYAESITTTYSDEDGDGISGTDGDQDWSITFDDGDYTIDGENDIIDSDGNYVVDGNDITLNPDNGSSTTWNIDEISGSELIATYEDSDDDGEFTVKIEFSK